MICSWRSPQYSLRGGFSAKSLRVFSLAMPPFEFMSIFAFLLAACSKICRTTSDDGTATYKASKSGSLAGLFALAIVFFVQKTPTGSCRCVFDGEIIHQAIPYAQFTGVIFGHRRKRRSPRIKL
jgi:hypothetical protein